MAVNPSQAAASTPAPRPRSATPASRRRHPLPSSADSCPEAAKIGTVEVTTRCSPNTTTHEVRPTPKPANRSPSPARLRLPRQALRQPLRLPAGHLHRDRRPTARASSPSSPARSSPTRNTGRLTHHLQAKTPQLPLARLQAPLLRRRPRRRCARPPTCGTHTTTSTLTPWSAPEGAAPTRPTPSRSTAAPAAAPAPRARPRSQQPRLRGRHHDPARRRLLALRPQPHPRRRLPAHQRASTSPCPRA